MRKPREVRHGQHSLALGAAAGIVAASAFGAAPGWAFTDASGSSENQPTATSSAGPASTAAADSSAGPSGNGRLPQADLDAAILRDLGLTPEQFAAAGELGSRAAAAAEQLRAVPGYVGIRLQDNKIIVTGSGRELESVLGKLAATLPGISLEEPAVPAPNPSSPATEPAGPPPSSAPQRTPSTEPAAPAPGSQVAASTEQLFQAYVREVGTAGLQAVVTSGGRFVIRTGGVASAQSTLDGIPGTASNPSGTPAAAAAPGKISPSEFVSRYANVVLDGAAPLKPEADVPGGVGYRSDTGFTCSTGFSAFDPAGLPTVLTAGHCTEDGTAKTADLLLGGAPAGHLGSFAFSQFGGPGNSPVLDPNTPTGNDYTALTDPGNVGTDIAVIGTIPQGLDPLPATSTHGDPSQPGPDVKIIGTGSPVPGMPVCRSGWRTAWSCGHISAVGIFLVGGPGYPADPNDIRAFNGFLSYDVQSSGGDSGGPWISGNFAVGTHSAGDSDGARNIAVAATLEDSLKVLPGYELELFLNKPAVSAPGPGETYQPGQTISGQVPAAPASAVAAGSSVRITVQGKGPFDVPVDADGNWSFTAPQDTDTLRFTAETVNGFSRSGAGSFEFAPAAAQPPAPPAPSGPPATPAPTTPALTTPAPTLPPPTDTASSPRAETPVVVTPPPSAPVSTMPPTDLPPADLANTGGNSNDSADLAYTGSSGVVIAAIAAAAALAVGVLLMVLVRRRNRRSAR